MPRRTVPNSGARNVYLSAYSPSTPNDRPGLHDIRALEGIKDKLQLLSERSGAAKYAENEEDVAVACDLADDLRDAIVEYQVSFNIENVRGAVRS